MTTHNNKPQENIEKCFEEIKQVLKKYECDLYPYGDLVKIKTQDGYFELYGYLDFNKWNKKSQTWNT